jgi:hypothetical protein
LQKDPITIAKMYPHLERIPSGPPVEPISILGKTSRTHLILQELSLNLGPDFKEGALNIIIPEQNLNPRRKSSIQD